MLRTRPTSADSHASESEVDLCIGSRPVIVVLLMLSMALALGARLLPEPAKATTFVPYLASFLALAWLLESWKPRFSRWLLVTGLLASAHIMAEWFALPSATVLAALPVALAAPLIGVYAGFVLAGAETATLLLLWFSGRVEGFGLVTVTLIATWLVCGLMAATQKPVSELAGWSLTNFQRARALLDEARDRQAELKEALDALAHANRQLALTYDKLAAARLLAEEARRTKAAFVANVSHEFRTPLNMIVGLVDMILKAPNLYGEELPPSLLKDLEIVGRNCEHLSSMINDVLDLSRIESGRPSLHRESVCLPDVIEEALAVVRSLTEKRGLDLQAIVPDDLPEVYCDRTRIRQVILNFVSNAARFTERGGITVQAAGDDGFVTVSVTDTGPGISPEEARRIFEPFYQGSTLVRRQGNGTGLGLSISKQFVELHGGTMWMESQVGAGSTFAFRLPASPPLEPTSPPERWLTEGWVERRTSPSLLEAKLGQRFVLCDATGELEPLFSHCDDQGEYVPTQGLEQAVAEMRRSPAQALVINHAPMDELWRRMIRARQELPDTPILGCVLPPKAELALAAGAAGYLLKPVTREDLMRALTTLGRPVREVLLVDDDPDVLALFTRMIETSDHTARVRTAPSGQQALAEARRQAPDVVLLDILMPNQDGWQTLEAFQEEDALRGVPIIIVSAQDPQDQPAQSEWLLATIGGGLPISKVLHCFQGIASSLLRPD